MSYLLDQDHPSALGGWSIAGAAVWLVGLVVEAVADSQKAAFRARDENRGRFVASGLWRYSRHPNYFGEMLVWWGLFVYAVPVLHGAAFAVVLGPLFITVLLLFVSGIPPLERSADKRYGATPRIASTSGGRASSFRSRRAASDPRPPGKEGSPVPVRKRASRGQLGAVSQSAFREAYCFVSGTLVAEQRRGQGTGDGNRKRPPGRRLW